MTAATARRIESESAVGIGNCVGCGEHVVERRVQFCRGCDARMCLDCAVEAAGRCGACEQFDAASEPDPDRGWDGRHD